MRRPSIRPAIPPFNSAGIDRDALIKELETQFTVWIGKSRTLDDTTNHRPWLPQRRASIAWNYWERYKLKLIRDWASPSIDSLDEINDEVLARLEDPLREGAWDRRGLIVGHVQSGKTANYVGLINKAVDAGYKVIVVLAGIHKSLRSQTQIRLDEGFLGYESLPSTFRRTDGSESVSGWSILVSAIPTPSRIDLDDGDFKAAVAKRFRINPGNNPLLFVIKKNVSVLRNLLEEWVNFCGEADSERGCHVVRGVPLLVIDDEADHASIDTGEQAYDEDGNPDPDHDPTRINALIRRLLHRFEKIAYVGYTATPFANIFIHESGRTTEEGDDLFPRSFIISLPAPSDYAGPLRIFGMAANPDASLENIPALPLVQRIDDHERPDDSDGSDESSGWMPDKHKQYHVPLHEGHDRISPLRTERSCRSSSHAGCDAHADRSMCTIRCWCMSLVSPAFRRRCTGR